MKISFYSRGNIVQAMLSDGSSSFIISTKIIINPHMRFNGEFKGKNVEAAQLNGELDRCKTKLTELYLQYKDFKLVEEHFMNNSPEMPTDETYLLNELLRRYVTGMSSGEITSYSKKKYSQSSIKIYQYVYNMLNEFSFLYKKMDIRDYHIDPQLESKKKRDVADKFNGYWKKYENYLVDRGLSVKSRSEIMNMTGVMTTYWANYLFFSLPKIPRLTSHEKAIVVLPNEFVKRFLTDEDKVYNSLSPELKFVWELSATILITTLRIGDAMSINQHDLIVTKDLVFLKKKNEKTGVFSEMPLPNFLSDIYRNNLTSFGRVYTIEPDRDVVYAEMKTLFKMYEDLNENVSITDVDVRGNEFIVTKPLWEWVHPHLLRKTAITTMIYNKVPERFIKFASGHTTNSTAFERYVGHVEKYYKSEMNDYYGRIFG